MAELKKTGVSMASEPTKKQVQRRRKKVVRRKKARSTAGRTKRRSMRATQLDVSEVADPTSPGKLMSPLRQPG